MTTPNTPATPPPYYHDDEISLVDLAKILVKRWKIIVLTFIVIVGGALAYALMQERTYQYVSLYHVAEQGTPTGSGPSAVESPNSVMAKIQNLYLGPITRELRESAGIERLPFEVNTTNPDDTLLVRLVSESSEANAELVADMHERLMNAIITDQQELVERNRERLEQFLQQAQRALEAAESGGSSGDMLATLMSRVTQLEAQLAGINEGEVIQIAVQSLEPTGTSRSLIVALGLVLGGMLALMAAFISHFIGLVCASLREE